MQKTILIVDDFENSLSVTAFTIERNGYKVLKANSGAQALQILKSGVKIDLLITDFNMPLMNGIQLIIEVKKMPIGNKIPFFILSNETKEAVKAAARKEGVTAWIKKPFQTEKLIEFIKRATK